MVDFMDQSLLLLPLKFRPENLLGFSVPGLGIVLTALVVLIVTGMLAANLFGRKLVKVWESALDRIPLVRSVYSAAKTFAEVVLTDSTQSFKEVLLDRVSPQGALQPLLPDLDKRLGEVQSRTGEEVICVFVPTTPNPTSGVMIMVPRKGRDRSRHADRRSGQNGGIAGCCSAGLEGAATRLQRSVT